MQEPVNLLIVDDERGPMESLRMIFKPFYNVYTANGGPEALQLLEQQAIDVVTLDLKMPGMSGIEVMERIKSRDPDIEVVIVTGYSSLETAIRGLRFRAFDYISKPFDVSEISDIVRRAVQQRRSTQRLRQMKEDFLANLSHELRTPLSAIIGYSAILNEELHRRLTPEQRLALERIQANSHDLLNLIEAVLLLNSIDAGELSLNSQPFNLSEVVRRAVRHFENDASERGLVLEGNLSAGEVFVISDELKVERILWALLDNAIKFTPHGRVMIDAMPGVRAGTVEIHVADTGIGMADEELLRALEGLAQGDPSTTRLYRGLGLGLRMAMRLVHILGGDMRVRSEPGKGTVVVVTLPSQPAMNGKSHA
jgi:signal transduction histidine kinase